MQALARMGYALAGALAAMLAGWAALQVVPSEYAIVNAAASLAAPTAVLMAWAALKPSRGSKASSAAEAALVTIVAVVGAAAGGALPGLDTSILRDPVNLLATAFLFILFDGEVVVAPVAWMLGSSERWARRPWGWAVGEVVVAFALVFVGANRMLLSLSGLQALPPLALLLFASGLAFGAAIQRLFCGIVWRARGEELPRLRVRRGSHSRRAGLHVALAATLICSILASALSLAFFVACSLHAEAEGLMLRNLVYLVPMACVLATCLVVVPLVVTLALVGPSRNRRLAGFAVLGALILLPAMLLTSFRLEYPEGPVRSDGSIEVVTRPLFGVPTVQRALPEGPFFMRIMPDKPVPAPAAPPAEEARPVGSYLTSGEIVSLDAEARSFVLMVTNSSCERLSAGDQVAVSCSSAAHFDVSFEELAVGESVQIGSTQGPAERVLVAKDVHVEIGEYYRREGVPPRTLDDILASYGCPYTVTGTVTSGIGEGGFSFRVDDGGGFIEDGTELRVSEASVERRLYGMKGLQWGMDGVVIGFSDMPVDGVLQAKVIVGNDDTSSEYWENMPPA